ncbi:MAG TPA: ThiF family adenylyltransferase [Solirubrobacteraceae bacterium]|nr:ThiF family adenylyltransferase [Solirubrobacteraceae bacterium]
MDRQTERLRTFAHLAGLLEEELPAEVFGRQVRLVIGEDVLKTQAGQVLVLTMVRLIPRLCHRIDFVSPSSPTIRRLQPLLAAPEFSAESLAALARIIWTDGVFTAASNDAVDLVIGIGAPGDVSVGIESGAAVVLADGAARIDDGEAVHAALVAAPLACAQIIARLYPEILRARVESLVRLDSGPFGGLLDAEAPRLERPFLAGVGAVGSAFIFAAIVVGATGRILLLDPDKVKDSNLMRYVLFDNRHLDQHKVAAAKAIIQESGLDLAGETDRVVLQDYLDAHVDERRKTEMVVSAVDTYQARREIAGWLPRRILNAGTNATDFSVSRHGFGDGYACLACQYPAQPEEAQLDSAIARELGLSRDEVQKLQRSKKGLTRAQLEQVATSRNVSRDQYLSYDGEPLDSFYNKEFCAKLAVPTPRGQAVAPLAHGSALAGFLLFRGISSVDTATHRHFRMDTMNGLNHPLRRSPRARGGCPLCTRRASQSLYERRWGRQYAQQTSA